MTQGLDPYAVLGVSRAAATPTIRKAYHALARSAHPDLVGESGLAMMQRLNEAWATLRDPARRAAYDATLRSAGNSEAGATAADSTRGGSTPAPGARSARAKGPAWTGAAGPPPGRPSGSRIDFGLYAGWTLGEIARHDNGYLAWLLDRKDGRPYVAEIRQILERMRPAAPERPRSRRWRGR